MALALFRIVLGCSHVYSRWSRVQDLYWSIRLYSRSRHFALTVLTRLQQNRRRREPSLEAPDDQKGLFASSDKHIHFRLLNNDFHIIGILQLPGSDGRD